MSNITNEQRTEARHRFEEMKEVYASSAASVRDMIQRLDDGDDTVPRKMASQLGTLHDLFLRVRKAEEDFLKTHGLEADHDDTDYSALREELIEQMDRLSVS